jgi:hypothetical protein
VSCPSHAPGPCEESCIWRARAETARARAEATDEGATTWWARIQLPNGTIVERATRRESVVSEWKTHPRNRLIELGSGVPPWEQDSKPEAPRATTTGDMAGATGAAPISIEDVPCPLLAVDTASAVAAPASASSGKAPESTPSAGPDLGATVKFSDRRAGPEVVVTVSREGLEIGSLPTSAAGAAEDVARSSHNLDQVIDQVLDVLAHDPDLRVRKHANRIVSYLAERRAGVRLAKRDQASQAKPF